MNKTVKRITAAALAGVMATSMATTASALAHAYKCECGNIITSTLNATSTSATATTTTGIYMGSTSVTIEGKYYVDDSPTPRSKSNGWGAPNGSSTTITNDGGTWADISSTHSRCCDESRTHLSL